MISRSPAHSLTREHPSTLVSQLTPAYFVNNVFILMGMLNGVKREREGEFAGRAREGLAQKACEIVKVILKYFTI